MYRRQFTAERKLENIISEEIYRRMSVWIKNSFEYEKEKWNARSIETDRTNPATKPCEMDWLHETVVEADFVRIDMACSNLSWYCNDAHIPSPFRTDLGFGK